MFAGRHWAAFRATTFLSLSRASIPKSPPTSTVDTGIATTTRAREGTIIAHQTC